ncbi:SusD/RagB family nutrient-binding outer membrane lipoprotein [Psychroserpens algicola]|uniref:SusD/RagB family nutrient-binding outer membrane lipoprotein n=1 Tax=Psychroserpens algicola TaxID=1719034 RepID=A0ABT0H7K6_9FLAO|nr:SusD/RagB family nutrient-binding outer membrane lipoprotein [Psychroserpens algicola]MCK8480039.1 SusD/RagB family nutrient-binding outer membrane lipoprotein [Psychroserpens algicola]
MKKINIKIFWALSLILFISCETTELDLLVDPNLPSAESLDPDTNLNFVAYSLSEFFEEATEAGGEAVRLEYMFDTYQVNFNNANVNLSGMWTIAYTDILNEISKIEPTLIETGRVQHLGILKIMRAYTLMTLVDYFGDVPYSDALNGGDNFPTVDAGSDVYTQAFNDLNDALVDFSNIDDDLTPDASDLFYGGDVSKWTRLANSLKLKYHLSRRLVDEAGATAGIAAILMEDNFISDSSDDFFWQAGTSNNPQSKHQYYVEEYEAANTGEYIPNYLAWALTEEKGIDDPRLRYYIYRQVSAFPSDPAVLNNEIDCWNDPRPDTYAPIDAISAVPLPFCSLFDRGDGYWGRDHSENDGIPPDNDKRMTFGTYPAGGIFDDGQASGIDAGDGLNGAGIWPIMMNSFVYFMRAEAAIYLGTTDDPRAMLEEGVRNSISTVMGTLPNPGSFDNVPDSGDVDDYVAEVLSLYDAATGPDERMAVIAKEYWIAMYGNGVEGYNLYRRTGTPINLQPTYLGTGEFPRSFLYPSVSVDRNPNINQKPGLGVQVFWDNNPAGFIQ